MPPWAMGLARNRNAMMPTAMATTTNAIATGATGGNVRFALSNSSVMGTCPASCCGAMGLRGTLFSAMNPPMLEWRFRPTLRDQIVIPTERLRAPVGGTRCCRIEKRSPDSTATADSRARRQFNSGALTRRLKHGLPDRVNFIAPDPDHQFFGH